MWYTFACLRPLPSPNKLPDGCPLLQFQSFSTQTSAYHFLYHPIFSYSTSFQTLVPIQRHATHTGLLSKNILWKRLCKSLWQKKRFCIGKREGITKDKEWEKCFLFPKLFQSKNIFRQRGFKLFPVKKRLFHHGQREYSLFVLSFVILCLFPLQKLFFSKFLLPTLFYRKKIEVAQWQIAYLSSLPICQAFTRTTSYII